MAKKALFVLGVGSVIILLVLARGVVGSLRAQPDIAPPELSPPSPTSSSPFPPHEDLLLSVNSAEAASLDGASQAFSSSVESVSSAVSDHNLSPPVVLSSPSSPGGSTVSDREFPTGAFTIGETSLVSSGDLQVSDGSDPVDKLSSSILLSSPPSPGESRLSGATEGFFTIDEVASAPGGVPSGETCPLFSDPDAPVHNLATPPVSTMSSADPSFSNPVSTDRVGVHLVGSSRAPQGIGGSTLSFGNGSAGSGSGIDADGFVLIEKEDVKSNYTAKNRNFVAMMKANIRSLFR